VKAIRAALGGTVNDVVLTAITQGYRALLRSRGEDVTGKVVHTLVPVSVRAPGDTTHNNQVASIIAGLPVSIDDPVETLEAIVAQMAELKTSHQAEVSATMFELAEFAPPMIFAAALRASSVLMRRRPQRSVNTVTTNVPGPPFALYACGREMLEYLPFVPLSQGLRTGVAILSYNGKISFGISGDWDTTPDLEVLAAAIETTLAELGRRAETAAVTSRRAKQRIRAAS
jgi:diacylglycerol O-acyltransferase